MVTIKIDNTEDRFTAHNAIWKSRKVYNNLQETMLKEPKKIKRK